MKVHNEGKYYPIEDLHVHHHNEDLPDCDLDQPK